MYLVHLVGTRDPRSIIMYIFRRVDTFYYRRKLPQDIIDKYSLNEIKFSLRTTDKKSAKYLVSQLNSKYERLINCLRSYDMSDKKFAKFMKEYYMQARAMIAEKGYDRFRTDYFSRVLSQEFEHDYENNLEDYLLVHKPNDDKEAVNPALFEALDMMQAKLYQSKINVNIKKEPYRSAFMSLWQAIHSHATEKAVTLIKYQPADDEYLEKFEDELFDILNEIKPDKKTKTSSKIQPSSSTNITNPVVKRPVLPRLSEAIDEYIKHKVNRNRWTEKTADEYKANINILILLIGHDPIIGYNPTIDKITRKIITKCLDELPNLPTNINHFSKNFSNKSFDEIKEETKNKQKISPTSIYKYASRWSGFFKWLKLTYQDNVISNPLEGQLPKKTTGKARDDHKPFTNKQVSTLIQAFDILPSRTAHRDIKKWITVVCLYTGARLNEIAQLYTDDIKYSEEHDMWYFDLNDKRDDQQLKNINARRLIPIHPTLLHLGFLEYVDMVKRTHGDPSHLWKGIRYSSKGGYGKALSVAFNKIIDVYVTDDSKYVFHSTRHGFINNLKQNKADMDVVEELAGHSAWRSETRNRYSDEYNLQICLDEMKKLNYGLQPNRIKMNIIIK